MNLITQALIDSPVGRIAIFNDDNYLTGLDIFPGDINYQIKSANGLTHKLVKFIESYFECSDVKFDLPLNPQGTDFQKKVWLQLTKIPIGECWTYGQLAKELDTSPRAIGGACRKNPIPLIVPCHRVVAATGIGGYSGQWQDGKKIDVKSWLLKHEQVHSK